MPLPTIPAQEAKRLIGEGAILVDIRSPDEHAREYIPNARSHPLASISEMPVGVGASAVIFHCRSGFRTTANAATLMTAVNCPAYILEGGLESWRDTGFLVIKDVKRPIDIMRQVQILVGSFILCGILLGMFVAPAFSIISAVMGAGLIFAGVTGWCGMARMLSFLPMNRQTAKVGSGV